MLARLASVHACCFRYASRSLTCASLIGLRKCSANASHCDCSSIAIARVSVSRIVRPGRSVSRTAAPPAAARLAEAQPAGIRHPASSTATNALLLIAAEETADEVVHVLHLAADRVDRAVDRIHGVPDDSQRTRRADGGALDLIDDAVHTIQQRPERLVGGEVAEIVHHTRDDIREIVPLAEISLRREVGNHLTGICELRPDGGWEWHRRSKCLDGTVRSEW